MLNAEALRFAGTVLRDSILLVLRHWLVLVVALVALAEGCLLNLSLLGHCFGNQPSSCPGFIERLGETPQWMIRSIMAEVAGFLVIAVASYVLYTSAGPGSPAVSRLRGSTARSLQFFGRLTILWLLVLIPVLLLDLSLSGLAEAFPDVFASAWLQWAAYLSRTAAILLYASVLHARFAFYIPSAAHDARPKSLADSWQATRGIAGRLFLIFMLIGIVTVVSGFGLATLAYRAPDYFTFVDFVSGLLDVRSNYVMRHLGQAFVDVLVGLPGTLLEVAVSLVAFRQRMPLAVESTAGIFD